MKTMKPGRIRWLKENRITYFLLIFLGLICMGQVLTPHSVEAQLISLKTVPTPEPLNLNVYVVNRAAAIQLGKALFWDMQVGSDGVQACGTCHFHAGADRRVKNQLNPGVNANDNIFGNNLLGLPVPAGGFGPNVAISTTSFPFHKLTNKTLVGDPLMNSANVVSDCNDVLSSQGVALTQFVDIRIGNPVDLGTSIPDPVFNLAGVNIRRVEPRNTPTVINAVFNVANFWDGRANNIFNGRNPFGPLDPVPHAIIDTLGTLSSQPVALRQSSLASQAVGPPLSENEMSFLGRTWPKIGKKMLSLAPLAQQIVHPQDSVLGPLSKNTGLAPGPGLNTTYTALIQKAFPARFWNNNTQKITFDAQGNATFLPGQPLNTDEYTQMEANFSLFFGLAVQLYEATLIANDSPFDRFLEGAAAQTFDEAQGMKFFLGAGGCIACHFGGETTDAGVFDIQGADPITGFPQPLNKNPLNAIDFMAFFSGTAIYDGGWHNTGVRPGGETNPLSPELLQVNEDVGRGGNSDFKDPASGVSFPLSLGLLAEWKAGGAPAALGLPAWTANYLTPFVPPLPPGFRPIQTMPYSGRVLDGGGFKTPGLRNVELTGPYFHNGGTLTLRQVVDFYTRGGDFPRTNMNHLDPNIMPSPLLANNVVRKNQLVSFLLTMTDQRVKNEAAPFDHPEIFIPIDGRAPVSPGTRAGFLANRAMFQRIQALGAGGRIAEGLPLIGTFMTANPFTP